MASFSCYLSSRKVFILSLFGFTLLSSFFFGLSISETQTQTRKLEPIGSRRSLLASKDANVDVDNDFLEEVVPRKKIILSSSNSSKNQTNIIKPKTSNLDSKSSKKDETKLIIKPSLSTSSKNKTKIIKSTSKIVNLTSKSSNTTKPISKKSLNLTKSNSTTSKTPKQVDKTAKSSKSYTSDQKTKQINQNQNQNQKQNAKSSKSDTSDQKTKQINQNQNQNQKQKHKSPSSPLYEEEDEDLISGFRDLPTKFQQSFIPDLHQISSTSKLYLNKYNKEFTNGFKPYVGNKYATSLATAISCAFIIIPFLLVSLVFNQIKAYFSLQKLIIFIQIYLSIYFIILCISTLITGIEPLKFFYVTSQFTYVWLQVLQTLFYVLYLLLLLMYLILVFSTKSYMGQKFLGLGQTFVGLAVGLHYYMTVFHRVILRQPPKSSWKIHGIYATCFFVICLFSSLERRKKAYLIEGDEEEKTS